jgi:hypothetical protein
MPSATIGANNRDIRIFPPCLPFEILSIAARTPADRSGARRPNEYHLSDAGRIGSIKLHDEGKLTCRISQNDEWVNLCQIYQLALRLCDLQRFERKLILNWDSERYPVVLSQHIKERYAGLIPARPTWRHRAE